MKTSDTKCQPAGRLLLECVASANSSARSSFDTSDTVKALLPSKKFQLAHDYDDDDSDAFAETFASQDFGKGQVLGMTSAIAWVPCGVLLIMALLHAY